MNDKALYCVIDLKSFYASCECATRHLDIFTTPLVVCDPTRGPSTIVMSATPYLKKTYGVPNVCRRRDLPQVSNMILAQPRMAYYVEMSSKVVSIFLDFVDEADLHVIAPEDRIDPAAEAKIIGMLAAEASAFVPNVLPAVAKAEKIELAQEKLSPLEEKKVVKAIQKEASVFVPNDLSALEQICGTVKVNETQEALELNEKMKNEAGAFLAPSENRVYAQAGLKKRGFFAWLLSTKGIAISSGVVAATAAAVTLAIVLNTGSSATLLPAAGAVTVVNVAVTPASATTTTTTTSGVKAVLKAATTTTSANTYTPKASYQVDAKGLADSTTFTPKNYSGTLAFIAPSNTEAPAFSSSLLSSAYSKGYLETKDATKDNVITLRIISSDLRYNNTNVQNLYRTAMDNYLKSQKIYAAIEFDDTADINSDLNAFMPLLKLVVLPLMIHRL